jgi:hypothetical protein
VGGKALGQGESQKEKNMKLIDLLKLSTTSKIFVYDENTRKVLYEGSKYLILFDENCGLHNTIVHHFSIGEINNNKLIIAIEV